MESPNRRPIERFLEIQDAPASEGLYSNFDDARIEIVEGRKKGGWMKYMFPMLGGVRTLDEWDTYSIHTIDEAKAYLDHSVLRERLVYLSNLVTYHKKKPLQIFGMVHNANFASSMTLFTIADPSSKAFADALEKVCPEGLCYDTVRIIQERIGILY